MCTVEHDIDLSVTQQMITEISHQELDQVSGGNAQDTVTGSFVSSGQSFSDCMASEVQSQALSGGTFGGALWTCTIKMMM
jgi:hypothetical protein